MRTPGLEAWLEALRSGEYEQVQDKLALLVSYPDKLGYCCLGVACVIAGIQPERNGLDGYWYFDDVDTDLPDAAVQFLGLRAGEHDPIPDFGDHWRDREGRLYNVRASQMNDKCNMTFEQIADVFDYFGFKDEQVGWQ